MIQSRNTRIHPLMAALPLAVYGLYWILWVLHPFREHTETLRPADACSEKNGPRHIHAEGANPDHCLACHFTPAPAELPDIARPEALPSEAPSVALVICRRTLCCASPSALFLRGPPAFRVFPGTI